MTPKKNQAKSTQMQTDAADASKSKQKLRHWIKKLQINKKKQIVKVKNNALATDEDSHREGDGK